MGVVTRVGVARVGVASGSPQPPQTPPNLGKEQKFGFFEAIFGVFVKRPQGGAPGGDFGANSAILGLKRRSWGGGGAKNDDFRRGKMRFGGETANLAPKCGFLTQNWRF